MRARAGVVFAVLIAASPAWNASRSARAQGLQPPPPLPPNAPGTLPPPLYPAPGLPLTPVMPRSGASAEEAEDSGLGLEWVWLNADVGATYVNPTSLSGDLGLQKIDDWGPTVGVGGGVRLLFVTLGARVRGSFLSKMGDLWELELEAKFHTRIGRFDPYVGLRGGYDFFTSLRSEFDGNNGVSVQGLNVGPVIGLDMYLTKLISLGIDVDAQFLFLRRPALPTPPSNIVNPLGDNGSSIGFGFTPALHLGVHF